ncbi:MAG: isoprenoid biosynthesis glyoxalase ElbB [Phycisphaerales bacterium]|nr:MAG: isoprenoid biosynthesis glyoxalase ElbB [Phycisphaerales bacterium]
MPHVLVILSGCGVYDGSEIHEAVSTLLHLDRHGVKVTIAAPDVDQAQVVNHLSGEQVAEKRNVRIEAARIARGAAEDLATVSGSEFDAVILPGGFGAATNLCDFAVSGSGCQVNAEVKRVLEEAHHAGRPLGFICIAPTIAARLFPGTSLTIGSDEATAAAIEKMGARHAKRLTEEVCVDESNRIATTPAYMTAQGIGEVHRGIGNLVDQLLGMVGQPA